MTTRELHIKDFLMLRLHMANAAGGGGGSHAPAMGLYVDKRTAAFSLLAKLLPFKVENYFCSPGFPPNPSPLLPFTYQLSVVS